MKMIAFAAALLLAPMAATADETSALVEACEQAVGHWLFSDEVTVIGVQDFSNLTPPRARVRIDSLLNDAYSCTFTTTSRPYGLTRFCTALTCHEAGSARFDEVFELLRRDGY